MRNRREWLFKNEYKTSKDIRPQEYLAFSLKLIPAV